MNMEMTDSAITLKQWAQLFRIRTFEMLHRRGNGHWGGSSSAADLLTALYFNFLKIDHNHPDLDERDRLVLSKGHAAPILYQILSEKGFFHSDELAGFSSILLLRDFALIKELLYGGGWCLWLLGGTGSIHGLSIIPDCFNFSIVE